MKILPLILFLIAFGLLGTAYAEPLENITVLETGGSTSSLQIIWNHDDSVSDYEIGCVSCMPNLSESTTHDEIILDKITTLDNGFAILYLIAYNSHDEIITAKQVIIKLT